MKIVVSTILGLLIVALIGAGVVLVEQRSLIAELCRQLADERTALHRAQEAAGKRTAELAALSAGKLAQTNPAPGTDGSLTKPKTTDSDAATRRHDGSSERWADATNSPERLQAINTVLRARLEPRYAGLVRQLGLTPDQANRFYGLLIDKRQAANDLTIAELNSGDTAVGDPSEFKSLVSAAKADAEDAIHALLGDSGYDQYRSWERAMGVTSTVNQLQAALNQTEPLTAPQVAQLQQIMVAGNASHLTKKVVATAQGQSFLTPTQQQALQSLQQIQAAAKKLNRSVRP